MQWFINAFEAIRDFIEMGGDVLFFIALLILVMWVLIIERIVYINGSHRVQLKQTTRAWGRRTDRASWNAHKIREAMISRVSLNVNRFLPLIKTLVALCPLLGLMGTVTGMIEVFDVMAFSGTGNARAMASGVSKATVPTMAGMVGALSGVFATTWLSRKANRDVAHLQNELTIEHED